MMKMPQELIRLLKKSLDKVENDPVHHLNLGYREAIYWALGPHYFETDFRDDSGYKRRVRLAILAVSQVLWIWQLAWPKDDSVNYILDRIKELIGTPRREIYKDPIQKNIKRLWEYTTELTNETRNIAGVVGMAAVEAYSLALWDGFTENDTIDFDRTDGDDFMLHDVHFYASSAYAGGPPYPIALAPVSDPGKRKEFWVWWLGDAVPDAWGVV